MSPFVTDHLETDNRLVLKHGNKILAIADYDTPPLETLFLPNREPSPLPENFRQMGFVTTDGAVQANDMSTTAVNMDQDIEPVREDIESITRTLAATFGEANAWVNGLYHGLPVSAWAPSKSAAWDYTFGEVEDPPFYRLLLLTQDGTGSQIKYRIEQAYRAKVTNLGERTMNRADAENFQFTFGLYKDPATGKTYRRAQDGPYYGAAPTAWSASTAYDVGDRVTVSGGTLEATAAGTSGATEPTNPATVGETVVDGTVTWERIA